MHESLLLEVVALIRSDLSASIATINLASVLKMHRKARRDTYLEKINVHPIYYSR